MEKYSFKRQVDKKGYYVEFEFDVKSADDSNEVLTINYTADPEWEISTKAGIMMFHDYWCRRSRKGLHVNIYEIRWFPVDTDNALVLFGIIEALALFLKVDFPRLESFVQNERYYFPDPKAF